MELEIMKEAENCPDCSSWLKYCNAECCNVFKIKMPSPIKDGVKLSMKLKVKLDPSRVWYYKLHGCTYRNGVLHIQTKSWAWRDGQLFVYNTCEKLGKDFLCTGHPNNKPKICRELTENYSPDKSWVTENCLFKYKRLIKDGKNQGEAKEAAIEESIEKRKSEEIPK